MSAKMKIEIWSDVMCPFCYIGKRKLETALDLFPNRDEIHIEWKSYQLNPEMKTDSGKNINSYLAEVKGISVERAEQMNAYVTKMAKEVGLVYKMENAIVANSFDAHRFSHFAKSKGLQDAAEESLFKAYFSDGKNTADAETLSNLAADVGLVKEEVLSMLSSNQYEEAVAEDINEANEIGVNGVPFFVFNRRYAISGAQDSQIFLETLVKAHSEWKQENHPE